MPGTLGQLRRNRRRITIPLDDGNSVFIDYRPGAITEGLRLEYQAAQADTTDQWQQAALIRHMLLTVIEAWDITDSDGQIIPLTEDGFIHKVSYDDQVFLLETINADAKMGEANGANSATPSSSTSSQRGKRATSRR